MMNRLFKMYAVSGSLLLLTALGGHAQVQDYASDDVIEKEPLPEPLEENNYPATAETLNDDTDLTNNPYYSSDWIEGQVKLEGGEEYESVPLRYDIQRNQLLVKDRGQTRPLASEDVRSFTLGPPRLANLAWFQRAEYLEGFDAVPDDQFVQVIHEGESMLLGVHRKEKEGSAFGPMLTEYYYISPQGEVSPFEPNREAILEVLADQREAVEDFILEAELDLDNVADLARIIIFYDREAN